MLGIEACIYVHSKISVDVVYLKCIITCIVQMLGIKTSLCVHSEISIDTVFLKCMYCLDQ